MRKILYFGYFIKSADYSYLNNSLKSIKKTQGFSYRAIIYDIIKSSFKYKASFDDYFMFEFYNKNDKEKKSYLTTGELYEFYTAMNDKKAINNFRDKTKFNKTFGEFINREYIFLSDCNLNDFYNWIDGKDYIMAKPNEGVAGKGIEKIRVKSYSDLKDLYIHLRENKLELLEEFIEQHGEMNKINPSSVNTIRIITVRWQGQTDIVAAVLRIGVGGHVDNFSAGGIAAPIDIMTGQVYKSAVSKKNLKRYECHPKTGHKIKGFTIPYWKETIKMVERASKIIPEVKTVGWDIAITKNGPELIEGNDNWNKDSFQLPYREGRKHLLDKYI